MKVLIVGGGIGGLALGAALARRDVEADLIERRSTSGDEGAGIVLGPNVMSVMKGLALHEAVVAAGHPVGLARITDASGRVLQQTAYAMPDLPLPATTIHRNHLLRILRAASPAPRLGVTLSRMESGADGVDVAFSDGTAGRYDVVVGADGIRSAVRSQVCGAEVSSRYSGYTCWRFVVDGHFEDAVVEMWGRGRRVGVVPLGEGKSYVFLTLNAPRRAPPPWTDLAGLRATYAGFADPARSALAALERMDGVLHNDIEDCSAPRWWRPRVVLLGDAAHAVTPNLGQGAGLAIEDAAALAQLLATMGPSDAALARYEGLRRPRAERIRDRSWTLGKVAQWESGLARSLRDAALVWTPESVARKELEKVVRDMPGVPVG
ncbi:FAD-dependent monooxygenase [Myxococcus qinghaiensis]|uniref:FAD-dependent monooxygenase n=1 Tax=Myxococcus qinghaiensis TaxID=2906758 RepID=UPI0020A72CAD|nr:FAD-dependent monooxygenase [Myxococcus qinghaiensis]MCP3167727.1 FAD-dependent monooxygenase [Myxococcus qinghaiensis]